MKTSILQIIKSKDFIIFSTLLIISICLTVLYRPYIYTNNISDFHFADFQPSLFCIPVSYYFFKILIITRNNHKKRLNTLIIILSANLIYEAMQLVGWGCDMYDIIAIFIGAGIIYLIDVRNKSEYFKLKSKS